MAHRDPIERLEGRLLFAAGLDLTGVEFRTINGTGNNQALPNQGAAETEQIRFRYAAAFPDTFGDAIITTPQRANPRTISNSLSAQAGNVPNARNLTDWGFQWGQWITHDLDLTRNGPEFNTLSTGVVGDFSIPIEDPLDPLGPRPIPFNRSEFVIGTGAVPRREVVNSITSYVDASMVYGSDPVRANALRTFRGGKLKTSSDGKLLPLNTAGLPNADQFNAGAKLFLAGDVRANEQVNLTVVHTLFVREHNRLADRIADRFPKLSDEQVYQVARRLVGAEIQAITYEEYLPAVLGAALAPDPNAAAYNPATDASITNNFAHAVFRFGHSQISPTTLLVDNAERTVGSLSIAQAFFNPDFLKGKRDNVALMLKGLASQAGQETDLLLVDGIRNMLFGPPGAGGLDLGALDIQRGRDHGLPDYNGLRRRYGLTAVTTFAQISSDPQVQAKLQSLFGTVNNIDPFVGALAEDHLPGSSVGPFIQAVVGNQFERLRDGDRFFYTVDPFLALPGIKSILDVKEVTLAKVIKQNTSARDLQDNVFFMRSASATVAAADVDSGVSLAGVLAGPIETQAGRAFVGGGLMRDVEQAVVARADLTGGGIDIVIDAGRGSEEGDGLSTLA